LNKCQSNHIFRGGKKFKTKV